MNAEEFLKEKGFSRDNYGLISFKTTCELMQKFAEEYAPRPQLTDEMIEKEADKRFYKHATSKNGRRGFVEGAKWARDYQPQQPERDEDRLLKAFDNMNKSFINAMDLLKQFEQTKDDEQLAKLRLMARAFRWDYEEKLQALKKGE